MRRTLYIPDELWEQLSNYLEQHPQENASSVVQVALKDKLRPRNGERLLELAGIVESAPVSASTDKNQR
ncbi:MAG: hypothetical protein F6K10_02665 [Moorea sp. SIO2B7]|nr:hypothetical protein [Moorena sp. SIO2B7]